MGGNGLLCAPAPLCDVRASCSLDRAQIPSLRSLPHQLSLPSGQVVTSVRHDVSLRMPFRLHRARAPVATWEVVALTPVRKNDPLPAADTCDGPSLFMTAAVSATMLLQIFAAKTRNCQVRSLWSWRNCLWPPMPPISHTTLSHTALSHIAFSHNLSSTISTLLTHTTLSHTADPHSPLAHNSLIRTSFTQSVFHATHTRTHAHTHTSPFAAASAALKRLERDRVAPPRL